MDDYEAIRTTIEREVTEDTPEIRRQFLNHFKQEALDFVEHACRAFQGWQNLESLIAGDVKRAHVAALVYTAINLHILSFKLFLCGYPIASGNLQRQVIETIAVAILSSHRSLDVLDRYINRTYSANKALRDLRRHKKKLGLNDDGINGLEKGLNFYHNYSHLTQMTVAEQIRFEDQALQLGASFDPEKLAEYRNEIKSKISLGRVLMNVIQGVAGNLSKW